ncbi:MAG TPA: N-acetylmuramoyl-L-alanine amidase [Saprospiraceae bacterium]|nr:N-acetylmuramoyl-L-alanine amidase [Saprospiraceae bacterium]
MNNYDVFQTQFLRLTLFIITAFCYNSALSAQSSAKLTNNRGPIIILDAGHGGKDPGARGKQATEKEICLNIALRTKELILSKLPEAQIVLTREEDRFVPLYLRSKLSNDNKADLYVSIHCNSTPDRNEAICGPEIYIMGLHKLDEHLEVSRRENATIFLEEDNDLNYAEFDYNSPESYIISSQLQSQRNEMSFEAAKAIEEQFILFHPQKNRGIKQAGFVVLHQVNCPSILLELGYLSNPKEEQFLSGIDGQEKLSLMIAEGVNSYFRSISNSVLNLVNVNTELSKSAEWTNKSPESLDQKEIKVQTLETSDSPQTMDGLLMDKIEKQSVYRVQIAASKNKRIDTQASIWRTVENQYEVIQENELYKYLVGNFKTKEDAEKQKQKLRHLGFTDAFVIRMSM